MQPERSYFIQVLIVFIFCTTNVLVASAGLWPSAAYSYACRNIINTIMTNETQLLRKIYLSHFIRNGTKGLWGGNWVSSELETEQNCNIFTPSSSGYISTSFSFSCGAAQPGTLRVKLSAGSGSHCFELQQLTPNSELQLTRTSCGTG